MKRAEIIQGGMGAGVSDWHLARAVSRSGQLGVVSGTALDVILARRLQLGDADGDLRRALAAFPLPAVAERILATYYVEGGKAADQPFATVPMPDHHNLLEAEELQTAANFVEVFLAKEGHDGEIGINYLQKIQAPLLPSLYGALLAEVDVVLVGAGIPVELPAILTGLCAGEPVEQTLMVQDATQGNAHHLSFDPGRLMAGHAPKLKRPAFLPIVSSATLASVMVKKCGDAIDGLIIEEPSAGGHNAPPRGKAALSPEGATIYGPRDEIKLNTIAALRVPFWLAGSYGTPAKLAAAKAAGASGIQVGTLFAFCAESGLSAPLKAETIRQCRETPPKVFRDPLASPTGFPFQVLELPGTLSDGSVYAQRQRCCDLGYLREPYERTDGSIGWRCPADTTASYARKGGEAENVAGRKCLCNALLANIALPQRRPDEQEELPLVTCGEDFSGIVHLTRHRDTYHADDVIDYLLSTPREAPLANADSAVDG